MNHEIISWDYIKNALAVDSSTLDISSKKNFCLVNLNGITTCSKDFKKEFLLLEKCDVSGNRLNSLAELRVLRHSILSVDASKNELEYLSPTVKDPVRNYWSADFEKLIFLDLSYNLLKKIPSVKQMPCLQKLILKHNQIFAPLMYEGLNLEDMKSSSLVELDLSENRLSYENLESLEKDLNFFCIFNESLKELKLELNPFTMDFPDYRLVIIKSNNHQLQQQQQPKSKLRVIDGIEITDAMKIRANKYGVTSTTLLPLPPPPPVVFTNSNNRKILQQKMPQQQQQQQQQNSTIPSLQNLSLRLSTLDRLINDALAQSQFANANIEALRKLIDELSNQRDDDNLYNPQLFYSVSSNIQDKVLDFVLKLALFTERHPEFLIPILRMLAIMSSCPYKELSMASIKQLQDYMCANKETEQHVIEALNECFYPKIKFPTQIHNNLTTQEIEKIKYNEELLECVKNLSRNSNKPEALRGITTTLINWICLTNNNSNLISSSSWEVIEQLSKDEESNEILSKSKQLIEIIVHQILNNNEIKKGGKTHLALLGIIKNLLVAGEDHVKNNEYFITKRVHKEILLELSTLINNNNSSNFDLASYYVDVLANFLQNPVALNDLIAPSDSLFLKLLAQLFMVQKPKILTSVCKAVVNLLKLPKEKFDLLISNKPVIKGMEEPAPTTTTTMLKKNSSAVIAPLLKSRTTQDKKPTAVSETLVNQPPIVQNTNNINGKSREALYKEIQFILKDVHPLLEYLNENSEAYHEMYKEASSISSKMGSNDYSNLLIPKFNQLFNPIIHEMLISIINVIAIYCIESQNNNFNAKEITKVLNLKDREKYLFSCLDVPSDFVRLAVVRCLLAVPLQELDSREVDHLVKLLFNVNDVSSGKTEEVIAISFEILTRLCISNNLSKNFHEIHGKESIDACLLILQKNLNRDTRGMEEETVEKAILSYSCVKFLNSINMLIDTTQHYEFISKILILEDNFSNHIKLNPNLELGEVSRRNYFPILIEDISKQVEYLLPILLNVSPSGPVAPRIVRRIADILSSQQAQQQSLSASSFNNSNSNNSVIFDNNQYLQVKSILEKKVLLEQGLENWHINSNSNMMNNNSYNIDQHLVFMKFQGLERIITHLEYAITSLNSSTTVNDFYFTELPEEEEEQVEPKKKNGEEGKNVLNPSDNKAKSLSSILPKHLMYRNQNMQDVNASLQFTPFNLTNEELKLALNFNNKPMEEEQQQEEEDELNELIIASLRVFHNCLKFGDFNTIETSRSILRNKFKSIANICLGYRNKPKFFYNATKFFILCSEILEIPSLKRKEDEKQILPLYLVVFKAADSIMNVLRLKITLMNNLSYNDYLLISHCFSCCSKLISQINTIKVSDSLIAASISFLLYDMHNRSNNVFNDDARENIIEFLSYVLINNPNIKAFKIIKELIRSEIIDSYPVRQVLIQELLKNVARLKLLKEISYEQNLTEWNHKTNDDKMLKPVVISNNNIFFQLFPWCAPSDRSDNKAPTSSVKVIKKPLFNDENWNTVIIDSSLLDINEQEWQKQRLTSTQERIITMSKVEAFIKNENTQEILYNHALLLLVLTNDAYCLYDDKRKLICRKPYRAIFGKIVSFSNRIMHFMDKISDNASSVKIINTFIFPTTKSAIQVCDKFIKLNSIWKFVEESLGAPQRSVLTLSKDDGFMKMVISHFTKTRKYICDIGDVKINENNNNYNLFVLTSFNLYICKVNWNFWKFNEYLQATENVKSFLPDVKTYNLTNIVEMRFVDLIINNEVKPAIVFSFTRENKNEDNNTVIKSDMIDDVLILFGDDLTRENWKRHVNPLLITLKSSEATT